MTPAEIAALVELVELLRTFKSKPAQRAADAIEALTREREEARARTKFEGEPASHWHKLFIEECAEGDRLEAEVARLAKLVFVPGLWKCASCKCTVVQTEISAETGIMRAGNSSTICPNECGPMWRVTERDAGNDLCASLEKSCDENKALRAKVERLRAALEEIAADAPVTFPDGTTSVHPKYTHRIQQEIAHAALTETSREQG